MTVLVYLGPSLSNAVAHSILPEAIYLPPIRHADLISDIHTYNPSHVLIIDGDFSHHLPVWHKECVYAALKGIRLYGSSSMGALRAAELADVGVMIGAGDIFHWYWEGVCESDDEVALLYHVSPCGENSFFNAYIADTCPLVNIRAGLLHQVKLGLMREAEAQLELDRQKAIHYTLRVNIPAYAIDQKRMDAIYLLKHFRELDYLTDARPEISWLTPIFRATLERERRIQYSGVTITLQNIDAYLSLHCNDRDQILWDSKNRALALILADYLNISTTTAEIEYEWTAFCARHQLITWDLFLEWLRTNAMNKQEFDIMMLQNARIRKLQKAYITTNNWSRQTQTVLDYLRTHNSLSGGLQDCADTERQIVDKNNEESVSVDVLQPLSDLLLNHFDATGIQISGTLESFLRETGIAGQDELRLCLERYALARQSNK